MVLFVVSKEGYSEMKALIDTAKYPLWVNANVLSSEEISDLRLAGVDVTNFTYEVNPFNQDAIDEALMTIGEHHPKERIWVEIQFDWF